MKYYFSYQEIFLHCTNPIFHIAKTNYRIMKSIGVTCSHASRAGPAKVRISMTGQRSAIYQAIRPARLLRKLTQSPLSMTLPSETRSGAISYTRQASSSTG